MAKGIIEKDQVPQAVIDREVQSRAELFGLEEIDAILLDMVSVLASRGLELNLNHDQPSRTRHLEYEVDYCNARVVAPIGLLNTEFQDYTPTEEEAQEAYKKYLAYGFAPNEAKLEELRAPRKRLVDVTHASLEKLGITRKQYPILYRNFELGGEFSATGRTGSGAVEIDYEPFYTLDKRYEDGGMVAEFIDQLDAALEKELESVEQELAEAFADAGGDIEKRLSDAYEAETDEDFIRSYLAEEPESWLEDYPELEAQYYGTNYSDHPGCGDLLGSGLLAVQDDGD